MERHERFGGMVVAISLMVVACAGEPADEPDAGAIQPIGATETEADAEATDPDAASEQAAVPEPETEPEPAAEEPDPEIDVTVIPDEITPEYVEAVLVELEQLYIDAYIEFQEDDEPTLAAMDAMGSAFTQPQVDARMDQFADFANAGYEGLQSASEASARIHQVQVIHDLADTCIYVETRLDLTGVLVDGPGAEITFVELGPRDLERVVDLNPTPWLFHRTPAGDTTKLREMRPCSS